MTGLNTDDAGRVEWALTVLTDENGAASDDGFFASYCNTIATIDGGTHETGFKAAITKGIKAYGEKVNNKAAATIIGDDVDHLAGREVARYTENALRDPWEIFLASDPKTANALLDFVVNLANARIKTKQVKDIARKTPTKRARMPAKLADCSKHGIEGTELFIVEGESAGGTAKQARDRATQAIMPLRGKVLNVISNSDERFGANKELNELIDIIGAGTAKDWDESKLRYEKIIVMTDADVDGRALGRGFACDIFDLFGFDTGICQVYHKIQQRVCRFGVGCQEYFPWVAQGIFSVSCNFRVR